MVILFGIAAHIQGVLSICKENAHARTCGHISTMKTAFMQRQKNYLSCSKQMAAFHSLKDVWSQFRLARQVGLGQRLLHSFNLHQTQRSLIPCSTQTLHIACSRIKTLVTFKPPCCLV